MFANPRFITCKHLQRLTGKGKTTIHRWVDEGRLPKPVRLGPGTVVWLESEINEWLARKVSERA